MFRSAQAKDATENVLLSRTKTELFVLNIEGAPRPYLLFLIFFIFHIIHCFKTLLQICLRQVGSLDVFLGGQPTSLWLNMVDPVSCDFKILVMCIGYCWVAIPWELVM
jgi:hypothetical protein